MQESAFKRLGTVGIDLGTTRSVLAYLDQAGRPRTLVSAEGELSTPSAVLFEDDRIIVGREAMRALTETPERVARFAKREMGNAAFLMTFDGHEYSPEMIQSFVLGKLRADAERLLGMRIQSAVLTVPAFFDEPKRRATIDAGLLAGLDVQAIINEPTSAAIAYGVANGLLDDDGAFTSPQTILVYDLGGGTFDVSLLRIQGRHVDVVGVDGNSRLGGIDWDNCIVEWILEQARETGKCREGELIEAKITLLSEAEELKHSLSARREVKVRTRVGKTRVNTKLTRETFEELTAHLLDRTRFLIRKVLTDTNTKFETIDRVLLVGGSTRMPQVRQMLEKSLELPIDRSLSPDEAVAHGAAIYSTLIGCNSEAATESEGVQIRDVNAHHLGVIGVERETGRHLRHVMIRKNTPLPASASQRFQTIHHNQRNVLVRVVEGGDARGQYATLIGKFVVYDLPTGLPAGTPVDVRFSYDRDGIIEVEASVSATGRKASIRIERNSVVSESQLQQRLDRNRELLESLGLD